METVIYRKYKQVCIFHFEIFLQTDRQKNHSPKSKKKVGFGSAKN